MKNVLRSLGAVILGFVLIAALSTVSDAVLESIGAIPKGKLPVYGAETTLIGILAYRAVFSIAGCFLTAKLAPSRPLIHALILGALGMTVSLLGSLAMPSAAPLWFNATLVAMALPLAWLGGTLERNVDAHLTPRL